MSWSDLSRPDVQAYWARWSGSTPPASRGPRSSTRSSTSTSTRPSSPSWPPAGTVPDVMSTSNAWMRDFWALGGLTALDDRVKRAPDLAYSKFVPASAFYGIRQGKIAGVPTGGPDSEVTLVNTQYFREAGLDPSYDKLKAWTWEDFDTAADSGSPCAGRHGGRAGRVPGQGPGRAAPGGVDVQPGREPLQQGLHRAGGEQRAGGAGPGAPPALLNGKRVSNGLGGSPDQPVPAGQGGHGRRGATGRCRSSS